MKIVVLGGGAWGTAIASVLAHNNHTVHLWCYEQEVTNCIKNTRCNTAYLPNHQLDERIQPTSCIQEALSGATLVFEALPVMHMRAILQKAVTYYTPDQKWVLLSKGLEQGSLLVPSELLQEIYSATVEYAVVMGPSFARDVVQRQYTAVTIAGHKSVIQLVKRVLQNDYFLLKESNDVLGMQWCAILKNCVAVGMGILQGSGYTDNTKTFFLVQALHEIQHIISKAGGDQTTVYGLAGIGDLVLTTLGSESRNGKAGILLAQGLDKASIKERLGHIPEGFNSLVSVHAWLQKKSIHAPLLQALYEIVEEKKAHDRLVHALLKTI